MSTHSRIKTLKGWIMSLLNTIELKHSYRKTNKVDKTINKIIEDFNNSLLVANEIIEMGISFESISPDDIKNTLSEQVKSVNSQISTLRNQILSGDMRVSKESTTFDVFSCDKANTVLDINSLIGLSPRAEISEIKEVADKFGFCIFDEKVFGETNTSSNANSANKAAKKLKEKGYKIYYLSPLSAFNYASFINSGSGVYDISSYWGNHLQTFNTLALSLNVFRDLYSIVDSLKKENESIRKAIDSDRQRIDAFHAQFKQYVSHVFSNMRMMEPALNHYIDKENTIHQSKFVEAKRNALENNARYPNRYERVEYTEVIEKSTGKNLGEYNAFGFWDEDYNDYKFVNRVDFIDRHLPVPVKAFQYENFYAKQFNVTDLSKSIEIKKFKKSYNVANVKKMILSELGNNYMMLAVKGDIMNPENDKAIVLSSWGEGISEETMIALGVKQYVY